MFVLKNGGSSYNQGRLKFGPIRQSVFGLNLSINLSKVKLKMKKMKKHSMGKYIYLTKWQIFCDLRIGHLCNEASCYLISGGVKINQRWGINHFLNLSVFSMQNILTLYAHVHCTNTTLTIRYTQHHLTHSISVSFQLI